MSRLSGYTGIYSPSPTNQISALITYTPLSYSAQTVTVVIAAIVL